jgi:hypothetical protein
VWATGARFTTVFLMENFVLTTLTSHEILVLMFCNEYASKVEETKHSITSYPLFFTFSGTLRI